MIDTPRAGDLPPGLAATGPAESVGFTLSQLGLETSRRFGEVVGTLGLEPRQFALLRAVHNAEGQSQQVIGEYLQIPASTMVAIVDHLEADGLLERRLHASDRRTRTLHLTARGSSLLADAMTLAMRLEERLSAGLEPPERDQLLALLRRVAANLDLSLVGAAGRGSGATVESVPADE
ncbi:MAG TPA: MarR family transcriptional regulator [Acidimicrobiales bacterium]|nr:MarR family transcriptional regulator [Acidimicrobiales bacterium]